MKGPDVPRGRRVEAPVSLVDGYQTFIEATGEVLGADEQRLPGTSLVRIANGSSDSAAGTR